MRRSILAITMDSLINFCTTCYVVTSNTYALAILNYILIYLNELSGWMQLYHSKCNALINDSPHPC